MDSSKPCTLRQCRNSSVCAHTVHRRSSGRRQHHNLPRAESSGQSTGQRSARQTTRHQAAAGLRQLNADLLEAVHSEQYGRAAQLRDAIKQLEDSNPVHQLEIRLKQAVAEERFQEAAALRDEIVAATPERPSTSSDTVTEGIRVQVKSVFMRSQSSQNASSFVWAYKIKITNQGEKTATLKNRHWIILHEDGHREEVRGPGVVGEQPNLAPGQSFSYSSYCQLPTSHGSMQGFFEFLDMTPETESSGRLFDVAIGKFGLDSKDDVPPSF